MSAPDYTIVSFDDWEAMYCNGEKVLEGHSLSVEDVLEHMEVPCKFEAASGAFLEETQESGYVPDSWRLSRRCVRMSEAHNGQYVIVRGAPKGTPVVYATAYGEVGKATAMRYCLRRYPETESNAVRVVRSCDLDPSVVKGPTTL